MSHGGSWEKQVVRITADFQQGRVLHPAAKALLNHFFDNGWADPNKLNHNSRQTAILLQQVREKFTEVLKVRPDQLEFLGESDLGFQLGISGLLKPESKLLYSSIDRQRVFAIASNEENKGRQVSCLPVNHSGQIGEFSATANDVVAWQVANGESGNLQKNPVTRAAIFADCTASGVDHLPNFEYQTALFDSASWQGPAGFGVLVIRQAQNWQNPLPHNDHTRVPGTFSIPLAIASSVALEGYLADRDIRAKLKEQIVNFINSEISDVDIASSLNGLSKFLSFSISGIEADRLLLSLEDLGFAVDSGSACKSADMQPSHVLAAMGRPITGNIRLTLHKDLTEAMVKEFCQALKSCVAKLRSN
jgi:cysteine desulfurase